MIPTERMCKKCGVVKPIDYFSANKQCRYGREHRCKECAAKAHKAYVKNHKRELTEYGKRRYQKQRARRVAEMWENRELYKMKGYISSDKKKGLDSDIDLEWCVNEMNKPCVYCGHVDKGCNGLDRIDNSVGHTKDNCVSCCSLCNMTRGDRWSHEDFMLFVAPGIKIYRSRNDVDRNNR